MSSLSGSKERRGFRLVSVSEEESLEFVLTPGANRVGSLADNDLVIREPTVSRRHAVIHWDDGAFWFEDLGSKNGTLVNGVRTGKGALAPGDELAIGRVAFRVESIDPGDATLAISLDTGAPRPEVSTARWSPSLTPTGADLTVPARWLGVLDRITEVAGAPGGPHVGEALAILEAGLGARDALLVEYSRGHGVVIRHGAGTLQFVSPVQAALADLSEQAAEGSPRSAANTILLDGDEPVALTASPGNLGLVQALIAVGDFPFREESTVLLPIVLRALLRASGNEPATPPRQRRPVPNLVYPEEYVPGHSEAMANVYHQLRHLLRGDIPVLITGETGVGKELVARILHASSPRSRGPFEAVNCAAIPTDLLEVELFGIEQGVATGVSKRDGKMVLANGGIIFLDEIADMSPALQAKLLRALQEKEVHPLGARRPLAVDVRVVTATNANLQERIGERRFRADLYYRIAGYTLEIPPLRQRCVDVPPLVEYFMRRFAAEVGKDVRGISTKALDVLVKAAWPGNVRELEHEVRRLVYLCHEGQPITSESISPHPSTTAAINSPTATLDESDLNLERRLAAFQADLIRQAIARAEGNKTRAAEFLGMTRQGLNLALKRLGLSAKGLQ